MTDRQVTVLPQQPARVATVLPEVPPITTELVVGQGPSSPSSIETFLALSASIVYLEAVVTALVAFVDEAGIQDKTHTYTQLSASSVWTVPHNLGKYPAVTVTDNLGNTIHPDVVYVSTDIIQVVHGRPTVGKVYCN